MTTLVMLLLPVLSIWNASPSNVDAPMPPPGVIANVACPGPVGGPPVPGFNATVMPTQLSAAFAFCCIVAVPVGPAVASVMCDIEEAWSDPVTVW